MKTLRVIGDVHGKFSKYASLIRNVKESVQVGDFGFKNQHRDHEQHIDGSKHKVLFGNHDDTAFVHKEHSLGDYGFHKMDNSGLSFFFARGAYSIDMHRRTKTGPNKTWRDNEQLSLEERKEASKKYKKNKPDVVITHDCPEQLLSQYSGPKVYEPSITNIELGKMFAYHQPRLRIHGHHHTDAVNKVEGTIFVGLGELSYIDITPTKNAFTHSADKQTYVY